MCDLIYLQRYIRVITCLYKKHDYHHTEGDYGNLIIVEMEVKFTTYEIIALNERYSLTLLLPQGTYQNLLGFS